MEHFFEPFLILFLLMCTAPVVHGCYIELGHSYQYADYKRLPVNVNDTAGDIFNEFVEVKQALVVYFDFRYVGDNGELEAFSRSIPDSVAPEVMMCAKGTGRNLLRLPLDATVLSMGVLGIRSMHMEVGVRNTVKECLNETNHSFKEYMHDLMSFLVAEVTWDSNITISKKDGEENLV